MSVPKFSRLAFCYGIWPLLYVVARAYGLALFTVYLPLGVVLLGMHRSRDVADPAMAFLAPDVVVRLGPSARWHFRGRPCRHVAAGSLVARVTVGMGHPFDRHDRVRLPDYSLVSTIAFWSEFDVRYWHKTDMPAFPLNVRLILG